MEKRKMSLKEGERLSIMQQVDKKIFTLRQASKELVLSLRHTKRIHPQARVFACHFKVFSQPIFIFNKDLKKGFFIADVRFPSREHPWIDNQGKVIFPTIYYQGKEITHPLCVHLAREVSTMSTLV